MPRHSNRYRCPCGETFTVRSLWGKHLETVHGASWRCLDCNYDARLFSTFNNHGHVKDLFNDGIDPMLIAVIENEIKPRIHGVGADEAVAAKDGASQAPAGDTLDELQAPTGRTLGRGHSHAGRRNNADSGAERGKRAKNTARPPRSRKNKTNRVAKSTEVIISDDEETAPTIQRKTNSRKRAADQSFATRASKKERDELELEELACKARKAECEVEELKLAIKRKKLEIAGKL